jgi:hypothetical protein
MYAVINKSLILIVYEGKESRVIWVVSGSGVIGIMHSIAVVASLSEWGFGGRGK